MAQVNANCTDAEAEQITEGFAKYLEKYGGTDKNTGRVRTRNRYYAALLMIGLKSLNKAR